MDTANPFSTINGTELSSLDLPDPEYLLDKVLTNDGAMMIYGPAGTAKTWIVATLAMAVAQATHAFGWKAPNCRSVLLIDGEMPLNRLKERYLAMTKNEEIPGNIHFLSTYHQTSDTELDLTNPAHQAWILQIIEEKKISLLIVDNISCTMNVEGENDAASWSPVRKFMIKLRSLFVGLILVHHPTKGGEPRGSGTRLDSLDTCMKVVPNKKKLAPLGGGASLTMSFDKARHEPELLNAEKQMGLFLWKGEIWQPVKSFEALEQEYKELNS